MNSIDKNWVDTHVDSSGEVVIPEGVEKIEAEAFKDNQLVKKIVMSNTIVEVGENAFSGCTNLEDIQFSHNLKIIGKDAFLDCKKVISIKLPKTLEEIGEDAFARCEELKEVLIAQEAKIKELRECVFCECKSLKEITLPKALERIGEYTFSECESLQNIALDELPKLISIEEGAFFKCKSLIDISIPSTVASIEMAAFSQCSSLQNIIFDINSSLNQIGKQAFESCESLRQVDIPNSVTEIGEMSFIDCNQLSKVKLSNALKIIPTSAFAYCSNLANIYLGENTQEIGRSAFYGCKNLISISIPDSIQKISVNSFINCSNLQYLLDGKNIKEIEIGAFENTNFKKFNVPPNVQQFEPILKNCANLEELCIGENTTKLFNAALKGCSNLRRLIINGDITYFPETTLEGCDNIEEVEVNGTSRINYGCFKGKSSIRKITIDGNEYSLDENEEMFSIQRHGSKVAIIVTDKDGLKRTRCINLEKGTQIKQNVNIYLANDGSAVRAINSTADISIEQLKELKQRGEKKIYLYGATRDIKPRECEAGIEYDLYNIDELIQAKTIIQEIKQGIIIPPKEDKHRQKKIYSQLVRKLSEKMEYDFFEEYMNLNSEDDKEDEKAKYEKMTQRKWEDYWEENKGRNMEETMLEDGNLLGLINGRAVCRGNVEIIRNLAAEFGIESIGIIGQRHTWNQVKLDGMWYDDDFTNYQSYLAQGNVDKCSKRFLCGQIDGKSEFSKLKLYSQTLNQSQTVGKSYSLADKKFLLNYGRVQQQTKQQNIRPQEKERPPEESIKDEVGAEFKPKTQEQQKNEQEAQTLWMNRLQASDNIVDKMQEGARKKQEVAKLIQDIEQERRQERNEEIQEENQYQEQR